MKHFYLLIILLLSLNMSAQTILNEDLEWYITNTIIDPIIDDLIIEKYVVKIGGSKTINGISYKHLLYKTSEDGDFESSDKYIRQVNDTILVYHAEYEIEIIEYIENTYLDQIIQINQTFQSCAGKVIELDSIESFGKTYKTTKLDWTNRTWIAGIGTTHSMFTPYTCSNQGNIVILNCVYENQAKIYQRSEEVDCINHFTTSNEEIELTDIKVFPNPVQDMLQFNVPVSRISIYDVVGKLQLDKTINGDNISVDHLSPGIYFLKISDKNNGNHLEKIIKI